MSNKVEIYTTGYCPYCKKAKELLSSKGIEFTEIDAEPEDARAKMVERTGGPRTVPQVFIDNTFIPGGCDGLFAKDASGELDKLLGLSS